MKTEPSPSHPVEARKRLLAAALDQFALRGYAATSVRELCEAAGVTKPVLYYYFKSKEGLYLQLMEESYVEFETTLADLSCIQGSARERVVHFCVGIFQSTLQQLPLVKLIYSIYYGTPQGAPPFNFDPYYARMMAVIAELAGEGIAQGELRAVDLQDVTCTIMACLSFAIEEQLCHDEPRTDAVSMTRMLNLIFDGIAQERCTNIALQGA